MSLDELVRLKAEYDAKLRADGETAIKAEIAAVFDANPKLLGIRWTQYTPYFNDGEPCTFSIHEPSVRIEGEDGEADDDEDGDEGWIDLYYLRSGKTYGKTYTAGAIVIGDAVRSLYGSLRAVEEAVEATFGDHAQITATRDGITVDEYSHD